MQVTIARVLLIILGALLILQFFFSWQNGIPIIAIAFFDPVTALLHPATATSKSFDLIIACMLSLLSVVRGIVLVAIVLSNRPPEKRHAG
jgi:hypothetical protein